MQPNNRPSGDAPPRVGASTLYPPQPTPAAAEPEPADRPDVEYTQRDARGVRLAQGLGWFSIGLGVTKLLVPTLVSRAIGTRGGHPTMMRLFGLREILTGAALLTGRNPVRALDARLAGGAIDLAMLGISWLRGDGGRARIATAAASVMGTAGLDLLARRHLSADPQRADRVARETRIGKAVTIDAPPAELYAFWSKLDKLPTVIPHLISVERLDATRSRWTARGPGGAPLRWEAEIVEDIPDRRIEWKTTGGPLAASGAVRFLPAPGDRGTEVVVEMTYHVTGGGLGRAAAAIMGLEPGVELERGLRRMKQLFEIGELMSAAKGGA